MSKRGKKTDTLKLALGKVVRSHDRMLQDFKEKAAEYNIPEEEIPYKPLHPRLRSELQDAPGPLSSDQFTEEIRPLEL